MKAKDRVVLFVSILLILVGFWLALIYILPTDSGARQSTASSQKVASALKSASGSSQISPILIKGTPARIQISDLSIDLKVIPGYYYPANQSWTLSLNNAQYATILGPTNNQSGETFIYAHYRKGVFLNLPNIAPGMRAVVTTSNNHKFTYSYQTNVVVSPSNTQVFNYHGKPILVAQTCTGEWFQNRQFFIFQLVEAT